MPAVSFRRVLLTSVYFLAFCGVLAQDQESCQSLVEAASFMPGCRSFGNNCTGLACDLTSTLTVAFSVVKCTEPLEIDLFATDEANGVNVVYPFTGTGTISTEAVNVTLTATRDDFNDLVSVQINANGLDIVPGVSVPLNQSLCMCQSLAEATMSSMGDAIATDCAVNSECDGIECEFRIFTDYLIEVDWQRCDDPTGVLIALRIYNGILLTENYFNGSVAAVISAYDIPMYVTMENTNYSTTLVVVVEALDQMVTLINVSDVIVDKSRCAPPGVELPPAPPPSQPVSAETCSALIAVADGDHEALITDCSVTLGCAGLECSTSNIFSTNMRFLSCSQSIFVELRRLGVVLLAETVSQTTSFPLIFGTVSIIIRNVSSTIMGVEVDLLTGFNSDYPVNLLPYVQLRRSDYCLCEENDCPSLDMDASLLPSISTPMPAVSSRVLLAVTVPIMLVLLLAVVAMSILVVWLVWRKKRLEKRDDGSTFPFQTMTEKPGVDSEGGEEREAGHSSAIDQDDGEKKDLVIQ